MEAFKEVDELLFITRGTVAETIVKELQAILRLSPRCLFATWDGMAHNSFVGDIRDNIVEIRKGVPKYKDWDQ